MSKLNGNRIFILCVVVVLVAFTTQLSSIPVGGREYPAVLIACSFAFCIYLFFKEQKEEQKLDKATVINCLVSGVMIALYIVLLEKIGYILSTLLYLYANLAFLKFKNKIVYIVFPLVLTLLMYFLFNRGLMVFLPEGSWFSINL